MYCIYCDAETPNTATFCPKCGRQFPRSLTTPVIPCRSCRADNPTDAVFCWRCSSRLERDRAAGLNVPEFLVGGVLGAGTVEGISSQLQHTASDVGQTLGQGVTNAGQEFGHAATDAGQSLGRAATDAGHGLGHAATNMGQGLGHAPSTMPPVSQPSIPTSAPPTLPSQGSTPQPAPSSPSAPAGHPVTHPTPPQSGQPLPPTHPTPTPPTPHPVPPGHPGKPPIHQPHPIHPGEPEKGKHHKHHRTEHGRHPGTPHPAGSASRLVLGIVPKSLLIVIIGIVVAAGAIAGILAITSSHAHGTGGTPGGGVQRIGGGSGTGGNGGSQSTPTATAKAFGYGQMNVTFSGAKNGQVQQDHGSMVICGKPSPFLDQSSDAYGVTASGTLDGVDYLILVGSPSASPGTYTPGSASVSIGEYDPHIGADGTSDQWQATGSGTITINNNGGPGSGSFDVNLTGIAEGTLAVPAPLHIVGSYVCEG